MEIKQIQKLPLLREYEFEKIRGRSSGGFIYLPQKEGDFEIKHYGFGQLTLFHYLQPYFNLENSIDAEALLQKLAKGQERVLANIYVEKDPFLLRTIRVFEKVDLIHLEPEKFADFSVSAFLSKGRNYDTARIECKTDLRPDRRFTRRRMFRNF